MQFESLKTERESTSTHSSRVFLIVARIIDTAVMYRHVEIKKTKNLNQNKKNEQAIQTQ